MVTLAFAGHCYVLNVEPSVSEVIANLYSSSGSEVS